MNTQPKNGIGSKNMKSNTGYVSLQRSMERKVSKTPIKVKGAAAIDVESKKKTGKKNKIIICAAIAGVLSLSAILAILLGGKGNNAKLPISNNPITNLPPTVEETVGASSEPKVSPEPKVSVTNPIDNENVNTKELYSVNALKETRNDFNKEIKKLDDLFNKATEVKRAKYGKSSPSPISNKLYEEMVDTSMAFYDKYDSKKNFTECSEEERIECAVDMNEYVLNVLQMQEEAYDEIMTYCKKEDKAKWEDEKTATQDKEEEISATLDTLDNGKEEASNDLFKNLTLL